MSSPEEILPSTSERMGVVRPLTAKERPDQLREMGRCASSAFSTSPAGDMASDWFVGREEERQDTPKRLPGLSAVGMSASWFSKPGASSGQRDLTCCGWLCNAVCGSRERVGADERRVSPRLPGDSSERGESTETGRVGTLCFLSLWKHSTRPRGFLKLNCPIGNLIRSKGENRSFAELLQLLDRKSVV